MKKRKLVFSALIALAILPGLAQADAGGGFHWASSPPLIVPPKSDDITYYGVKDPSVVFYDGQYHVFMTTAGTNGWGLAYTHFSDWAQAKTSPIVSLDKSPMGPGYRAAPQVFYFAPQKLWYMVYQGGDPMYSTSPDIGDPLSWSAPKPFFDAVQDLVKKPDGNPAWLDFWIICDEAKCYLFFTNDGGDFFRAETTLQAFPAGLHNTTRVMTGPRDDVFEASNTYRVLGTKNYITLVEAIGAKGRYFRVWKSDRLDGEWSPVGDSMNVFAGADNVRFDGKTWSQGVSHGEMIRSGFDQSLSIDPCRPLQFLYQGLDPDSQEPDYLKLPYRLGLITATGADPVSEMCPSKTR